MTTKTFSPLASVLLDELRQFDSCTISNAIEKFDVRLRNTGFTDSSIHCFFPSFSPTIGYAATAKIRSSEPPMKGPYSYDRADWLQSILSIPAPRIVVLEDIDRPAERGAMIGELHANILASLGCCGILTNGAVRSLSAARALRFQMFAGGVSVSHAFSHVVEFGVAVSVGGMTVQPGDLLHGDAHGIQTVPQEIAARVPEAARQIINSKRRIISLCHSQGFSLERLAEAIKEPNK